MPIDAARLGRRKSLISQDGDSRQHPEGREENADDDKELLKRSLPNSYKFRGAFAFCMFTTVLCLLTIRKQFTVPWIDTMKIDRDEMARSSKQNLRFDTSVDIPMPIRTSSITNKTVPLQDDFVFYSKNPEMFVDNFAECVNDDKCQVFFHHVQKASGTYIGSTLFPWMNVNFPNPMQAMLKERERKVKHPIWFDGSKWCCYEPLMKRLRKAPQDYCGYKFSTWEVTADQMKEVIDICFTSQQVRQKEEKTREQRHLGSALLSTLLDNARTRTQNGQAVSKYIGNSTLKSTPDALFKSKMNYPFERAAVLVPFREPISRTVSLIHQLCNEPGNETLQNQIQRGNWNSLNFTKTPQAIQQVVDACHRCSYSDNETTTLTNWTKNDLIYHSDAEIWDHLVEDTHNVLEGVGEFVSMMKNTSHFIRDERIRQANHNTSSLLEQRENADQQRPIVTYILNGKDASIMINQFRLKVLNPRKRMIAGIRNKSKPYLRCHFNLKNQTNSNIINKLSKSQETYKRLSRGEI